MKNYFFSQSGNREVIKKIKKRYTKMMYPNTNMNLYKEVQLKYNTNMNKKKEV